MRTALLALSLSVVACATPPPEPVEATPEVDMSDDMSKVSYAIGMDMAASLTRGEIEVNVSLRRREPVTTTLSSPESSSSASSIVSTSSEDVSCA